MPTIHEDQAHIDQAVEAISTAFHSNTLTEQMTAIKYAFNALAEAPQVDNPEAKKANFAANSAAVLEQLGALKPPGQQTKDTRTALLGLEYYKQSNPNVALSANTQVSIEDNKHAIAKDIQDIQGKWPDDLDPLSVDSPIREAAQSLAMGPTAVSSASFFSGDVPRTNPYAYNHSFPTHPADAAGQAPSMGAVWKARAAKTADAIAKRMKSTPPPDILYEKIVIGQNKDVSPNAYNLLIMAQRRYLANIDKEETKKAGIFGAIQEQAKSSPISIEQLDSPSEDGSNYNITSSERLSGADQKTIETFIKEHGEGHGETYDIINKEAEHQNMIQKDTCFSGNSKTGATYEGGIVKLDKKAHSPKDYKDMVDTFYEHHSLHEKSVITLGSRGSLSGRFQGVLGTHYGREAALEQTLRKGGIAPQFKISNTIVPYKEVEQPLVYLTVLNRASMSALKKECTANGKAPPTVFQAMEKTFETLHEHADEYQRLTDLFNQSGSAENKKALKTFRRTTVPRDHETNKWGYDYDPQKCIEALAKTIMRSGPGQTENFQKNLSKQRVDLEEAKKQLSSRDTAGTEIEKINKQLGHLKRTEQALQQQVASTTSRNPLTMGDHLKLKKDASGDIQPVTNLEGYMERNLRDASSKSGIKAGITRIGLQLVFGIPRSLSSTYNEANAQGTSRSLQNARDAANRWNAQMNILNTQRPTESGTTQKVHDAQVTMALTMLAKMAPKTAKNGVTPADIKSLLQQTMQASGNVNDANMKILNDNFQEQNQRLQSQHAATAAAESAAENEAAQAAMRLGKHGATSSAASTETEMDGQPMRASTTRDDSTDDDEAAADGADQRLGQKDADKEAGKGKQKDDGREEVTTSGRTKEEEEKHLADGTSQPAGASTSADAQPGQQAGQQIGGPGSDPLGGPDGSLRRNDSTTSVDLKQLQQDSTRKGEQDTARALASPPPPG